MSPSLGSIALCRHGNEVLHQSPCLLYISQPAPPPGGSSEWNHVESFTVYTHNSYYKLFKLIQVLG